MNSRIHGIDAIRGLLMLLGIPFHCALIYSGVNWPVSAPEGSLPFRFLAGALTSFRMPVFFLIAGFFAALSIARSTSVLQWIQTRSRRLLIPFVAAMILLNPFQIGASIFSNTGDIASAVPSLVSQLSSWGSHWIRHLWFLPVLFLQSLLLALVWMPWQTRIQRLAEAIEKVLLGSSLGRCIICLVVTIASVALVAIVRLFDASDHNAFTNVIKQAVRFLPLFFFGALLGLRKNILHRLAQSNGILLAFAAGTIVAHGILWQELRGITYIIQPIAGLVCGHALLSLFFRRTDHASDSVRALADASFTIYLVHQPLISILGAIAVKLGTPKVPTFLVIIILTGVLSFGAHNIVERSRLLSYLLNGKRATSAPSVALR